MYRHTAPSLGAPPSEQASVQAERYAYCEKCQDAGPRLLGATWSAQATSALFYFRCESCGWVWTVTEDGDAPTHVN
jgi:hypothetical protein